MSNELIPMPMPEDNNDGLMQIERLACHFIDSGYFKDTKSVSQAVVKILKGRELGIGPFTAVDQINFIQGKPSPNANLIAALIRKSGTYDYEILELSSTLCSLQMFRHGKPSGKPVEFTIEDAKKAGLTRNATYAAYPKNMLFARCISNASKWACPDVTTGLYVPEDWEDIGPGIPATAPAAKPSSATNELIKLSMETETSLADINLFLQTDFQGWEQLCQDPQTLSQVLTFLNTRRETKG